MEDRYWYYSYSLVAMADGSMRVSAYTDAEMGNENIGSVEGRKMCKGVGWGGCSCFKGLQAGRRGGRCVHSNARYESGRQTLLRSVPEGTYVC